MSDEQKIALLENKARECVKQAGDAGISPTVLIEQLSRTDHNEDLVRMAIWDLVDQQELALSRDWILSFKGR